MDSAVGLPPLPNPLQSISSMPHLRVYSMIIPNPIRRPISCTSWSEGLETLQGQAIASGVRHGRVKLRENESWTMYKLTLASGDMWAARNHPLVAPAHSQQWGAPTNRHRETATQGENTAFDLQPTALNCRHKQSTRSVPDPLSSPTDHPLPCICELRSHMGTVRAPGAGPQDQWGCLRGGTHRPTMTGPLGGGNIPPYRKLSIMVLGPRPTISCAPTRTRMPADRTQPQGDNSAHSYHHHHRQRISPSNPP